MKPFALCAIERKYDCVATRRGSPSAVQALLRSGAPVLAALALLAGTALAGDRDVEGQARATTIYLDRASAPVGELATTHVVVALAPGETLRSFEVAVSSPGGQLDPAGGKVADGWVEQPPVAAATAPGLTTVAGERGSAACGAGATCLIATLSWRVNGPESSDVKLESARLVDDAGVELDFSRVDGSVVPTAPPAGPPAVAPAVVPSIEGAGAVAVAPTADRGVGGVDAAIGSLVVALGAVAIATPLLVWQARRRGRHKAPAGPRTAAGPGITLAAAVNDYLATYESAGRIDIPVDAVYDQIARQAPWHRAREEFSGVTPGTVSMLQGTVPPGREE